MERRRILLSPQAHPQQFRRDGPTDEVRFGEGRRYVARRVEANYATYTVRSYFGSLSQTTENAGR